MVSGVGFKNTANEEQKGAPRKRMVSRGLIVTAGFLFLIVALWGMLKMWDSKITGEVTNLDQMIKDVNIKISQNLADSDVSDFAVRAGILEGGLYRGYTTNDILDEIESIMIRKDSDQSGARVVLKSFAHNSGAYEKKSVGGVSATISGEGNITISADADTFDVMAQQIEEFKKSAYFDNVVVGTTDRDDSGRILFTLTMDVKGYDTSAYEKYSTGSAMNVSTSEDVFVQVDTADGEADVTVTDGETSVDVQNDDGAVNVDVVQ